MAMNTGMRMLMMDKMRNREHSRSEYGGGSGRRMIGYDRDESRPSNYGMGYGGMETENRRRRDSRGRFIEGGGNWEGYEHDSPHMGGYGYSGETEARRRRDSRGRYMMGGMMDDSDDEYEPPRSNRPQMHGGSRYGFGDVYAEVYAPGAMNRPGMMGGAMGDMSQLVDEHTARKWVREMDGGEKFKPEQIEQMRQTMCPECSMWEFYTAINAMYSDHSETAKKYGMDKPDFYASLAKDFLMDKDAGPHKLRKYMETIPKK